MKSFLGLIRRFKKKEKIALTLSSGSARGLSHIGAIKALKDENIPIELISGTSIGALVGACYARKGDIVDLEELVLKTDLMRLLQLGDLNLALIFKGFVHGKNVKELLKTIIGDIRFNELKIPLAVVATDANTGEEVVIKEGSVIEAVRASISLPVIFTPVKIGQRFLIDGGVVNPVPVNVAKKMGAKFIIVSNVIHSPVERKSARTKKKGIGKKKKPFPAFSMQAKKTPLSVLNEQLDTFAKIGADTLKNFKKHVDLLKRKLPATFKDVDIDTPGIFDVLVQALYAMEYEIARRSLEEADIIITPDTAHIGTLEFNRGKEAIERGYVAAKKVLSKKG